MNYRVNSDMAQHGFSLVEVLVAISIAVIFLGISLSAYSSIRFSNNLELATLEVIEALRYAQTNARAVKEDSSWGVKMEDGELIIFKGETYSSRDESLDQPLQLSSRTAFAGLDEVVFDRVTGFSDNTGVITFSISDKSNTIEINEKGIILY